MIIKEYSHLGDIFLNSVKQWPQNTALVCEEQRWTYQQLYNKTMQYAAVIRAHSGPEAGCVAILGNKSMDSIAAILATLLVGYAYMPIDLTLPAHRVQTIFHVAKPWLLLLTEQSIYTQQQLEKIENKPPIINLSSAIVPECSFLPEFPTFSAETIAYILFTSGSTGTPKGVCISHRAAVSAISMMFEHVHFHPADRIANQASLCYDLSMFDVFSGFVVGASIHLLPAHSVKIPKHFLNCLLHNHLTSLFIVTSAFEYLLKYTANIEYQLPLTNLLLTGEPVSDNLINLMKNRLIPTTNIWNLYSATEMPYAFAQRIHYENMFDGLKTFDQVGSQIKFMLEDILGKANDQFGELVVEGDVIYSGYLTETHPLTAIQASPLQQYYTGDLVELTTKGIKLHGRIDRQVKIHGNRVELDDIEISLESIPTVQEAAICFDEANQQIIAFVVLRKSTDKNECVSLNQFCQQLLSPIMHPHRFIEIDVMPRTVSGKKDRKNLFKRIIDISQSSAA